MDKCNNAHIYGAFYEKDGCGCVFRKCKNCGLEISFPIDDDFTQELNKYADTAVLIYALLDGDIDLIRSSDDMIRFCSLLLDNMFYIDVNSEIQKRIVEEIRNLINKNEAIVGNVEKTVINNFVDCLNIFFKMEDIKLRYGIGNFPDMVTKEYYNELCDNFDRIYDNLNDKFDIMLTDIYNKNEEEENKKSSVKR